MKEKYDPGGSRTRNLSLRRRTPYPLGYRALLRKFLLNFGSLLFYEKDKQIFIFWGDYYLTALCLWTFLRKSCSKTRSRKLQNLSVLMAMKMMKRRKQKWRHVNRKEKKRRKREYPDCFYLSFFYMFKPF